MVEINLCKRKNFCVDCDDPNCIHTGDIEADCPLWQCERPGVECEECDILREYTEAYRKEGDTIGQNMDSTGKR